VRTYRRLVEVDGKPRPADELARDDREHRKKVEEALERRAKESPEDRAKRMERRAKDQREFQRAVDDLLRVYRFTMIGRELVDGHPAIVIDFEPRPDAQPQTDGGRLMRKVRGRAWITEDDYQIARIEGETLDDFSFGWGIFGKVYKGTTATFERRKVNGEVWLPSRIVFSAAGRAFVRKFQLDSTIEYFDYRKFGVDTDTRFSLPKP
jgi:hypothetical protein